MSTHLWQSGYGFDMRLEQWLDLGEQLLFGTYERLVSCSLALIRLGFGDRRRTHDGAQHTTRILRWDVGDVPTVGIRIFKCNVAAHGINSA
jgi:hypothetical protein